MGTSGDVLIYDGGGWSSPEPIDRNGMLVSVSCPSRNFCLAIDGYGNAWTYDGARWSAPPKIQESHNRMSQVPCASATFCAAVFDYGTTYLWDGTTWSGVVLGGTSAGAICWFEAGLTDSFGPQLRAWSDGLGFLAGSFCPHYDREPRRSRYVEEVAEQQLPAGLACGDGATAHRVGTPGRSQST